MIPIAFGRGNTGDVGGQKTLRSYWRNYFEKTDSLIWVVDATDRFRLDSCAEELAGLLLQEVPPPPRGHAVVKLTRDGAGSDY